MNYLPDHMIAPLLAYFNEHVTPSTKHPRKSGFFKVTKELKVFKKTCVNFRNRAITNLIIPVGATVFVYPGWETSLNRKMRASSAIVHSSASITGCPLKKSPHSKEDNSFQYPTGATVVPEQGRWKRAFSHERLTCDAGIHFFLRLEDAQEYPL